MKSSPGLRRGEASAQSAGEKILSDLKWLDMNSHLSVKSNPLTAQCGTCSAFDPERLDKSSQPAAAEAFDASPAAQTRHKRLCADTKSTFEFTRLKYLICTITNPFFLLTFSSLYSKHSWKTGVFTSAAHSYGLFYTSQVPNSYCTISWIKLTAHNNPADLNFSKRL